MPIAPTNIANREEVQAIVAEPEHVLRLDSNWLQCSYFTANAEGEIRINPGMILARNGNPVANTYKYVPYSATKSYGPSSGTPVGILEVIQFGTYDDPAISPVVHAKVIEAHCYVYGAATKGSMSAAIKTALDDIVWV